MVVPDMLGVNPNLIPFPIVCTQCLCTRSGYGGTDKPWDAVEYSTKRLCADLAAILDLLGIKKAVRPSRLPFLLLHIACLVQLRFSLVTTGEPLPLVGLLSGTRIAFWL